ncbi:hypothetical protein V6N13_051767 [Hibiscus sabdariffa]
MNPTHSHSLSLTPIPKSNREALISSITAPSHLSLHHPSVARRCRPSPAVCRSLELLQPPNPTRNTKWIEVGWICRG